MSFFKPTAQEAAIPDSVVYQYPVSSFGTSTWTDQVGSADMAVNGITASTFSNGEDSVSGDGTDDYGAASGPQNLPQNQTFGIAFTVSFPSLSEFATFMGVSDSGSTSNSTRVFSGVNGPLGAIEPFFGDPNENNISVYTDSTFDDGDVHTVIVNKSGNSAGDIAIYVDDMSTEQSTTTHVDESFDHSNFNQTGDLAFFARNSDGAGSISDYLAGDVGIFEFNSRPYSQSERENFVSRRPEV